MFTPAVENIVQDNDILDWSYLMLLVNNRLMPFYYM